MNKWLTVQIIISIYLSSISRAELIVYKEYVSLIIVAYLSWLSINTSEILSILFGMLFITQETRSSSSSIYLLKKNYDILTSFDFITSICRSRSYILIRLIGHSIKYWVK